ncbi:MAG TPA: helix-turn-helix domain-containing protein [Tepidisphaeraceae bacterium]|jgi:hypothetical protein|nr:helix-turn-helix domain-containing protein [Tepidisphaeraceae bacterium]
MDVDIEGIAPGQAGAPLLDKPQAARLLSICERSVDNLRKRGKLRAIKIGSRVLFDPHDLARAIEAQKQPLVPAQQVSIEGGAL